MLEKEVCSHPFHSLLCEERDKEREKREGERECKREGEAYERVVCMCLSASVCAILEVAISGMLQISPSHFFS